MLVLLLLAAPLGLHVSAQSGVKLPVLLVVQLLAAGHAKIFRRLKALDILVLECGRNQIVHLA